MDEDFYDKCILISGAAGAVGKTLVRQLAAKCKRLILVDLPEKASVLKEISQETSGLIKHMTGAGQKKAETEILWYAVNICLKDDISALVQKLEQNEQDVDILINSAGINHPMSARMIDEDVWDKVLDVNLKGIFFLTRAIADRFLLKRKGVVVNISSQHSIVGNENRAHYCASKAGLVGMTKALACEWAKYNVRVNCVSPTFILTEKNNDYFNSPYNRLIYLEKIPLGEYALPEDVADGVIFLASSGARMITGHNLVIDGGYTIV